MRKIVTALQQSLTRGDGMLPDLLAVHKITRAQAQANTATTGANILAGTLGDTNGKVNVTGQMAGVGCKCQTQVERLR